MQHRGVYGIWLDKGGRIPLIRKSRGPYTGLLDLPGGTPEVGETPEQTLRRELIEECGVTVAHVPSWHEFDLVVVRDSSGDPIGFRHSGLIAVLDVSQAPSPVHDVEDIAMVELHGPRWLAAAECSALLVEGLTHLGVMLDG
ncbi:NUDIX domain-containing protein [Cellulomonas fimi]|uniref:NUDIX hydrolase n=1 Tax=Cellulomonas sp. RIT-PI-Y TaxID=3035297 RepID=UPI0021D97EC0